MNVVEFLEYISNSKLALIFLINMLFCVHELQLEETLFSSSLPATPISAMGPAVIHVCLVINS